MIITKQRRRETAREYMLRLKKCKIICHVKRKPGINNHNNRKSSALKLTVPLLDKLASLSSKQRGVLRDSMSRSRKRAEDLEVTGHD